MASSNPAFISELSATLTSLSSPGAERITAEERLNALLTQSPSNTLLGLIQLAATGSTEGNRILAYVLLRRLTFKPIAVVDQNNPLAKEVWDVLKLTDQAKIQGQLLECLIRADKLKENERRAICDLISEVEKALSSRATPWPQLSSTLSQLFTSPALALREAVFRIYSESASLLEAESAPVVIAGLSAGLKDASTGVRLSALTAAVALISNAETSRIEQYASLIPIMLEVLVPLAADRSEARLTQALLSFVDLASTPKVPARIFRAHLPSILDFCLSIIVPSPYQTSPTYSRVTFDETVRAPAIELLISVAEVAPTMTKLYPEFPTKLVPALLNLMGEREDDPDWLKAENFNDDDDDSMAVVGEGSLDRLSQSLGPAVFPAFLQHLGPLLNSTSWQHRHAGLSAIASIAEGCIDELSEQLPALMGPILQLMKDSHPRVQYAAIYAVGQLCTDLGGYLQEEYGIQILQALMQVTTSREPRVQAYGAAGTVNFLQSAEPESLQSILPAVFTQLCSLLQDGKTFVKENAMEALTLLARCMEADFAPLYPNIMPHLILLLETGADPSLQSLRARALDCAATIGASVDSSIFAPDATRLLQAMHTISISIAEDDDITERYLLRAYAQLAEVVGPEIFAPWIQDSFPRLVAAASKKPDMNSNPTEEEEYDEEWETVELNGDVVSIRTAGMEDKAEAVENLMILTQALGSSLGLEALQGVLAIALPLLKFYFHVGVREGAAHLVAACCVGLSRSELSQQQREEVMNTVSDEFTYCIASETDAEIVSTFIVSWSIVFATLPNCLAPTHRERLLKAFESQLTSLVQRSQERSAIHAVDADDDLDLTEQAEGDDLILQATTGALRNLLNQDGAALPLQPILPFLAMINTSTPSSQHFSLRLISDIIQSTGDASLPLVAPYLKKVLEALSSEDLITRRIAAFAVGISAESSPKYYSDFVLAGVEALFESIGPIDMSDNDSLAARDNAISALSRIIRTLADSLDTRTLTRWVLTLPVLVDGDEMIPAMTLLLELIASGHECVSPTSDIATHVLKTLVSTIQSEVVPAQLHRPVAAAFKSYLGAISGGNKIDIPATVEAKVSALLEY